MALPRVRGPSDSAARAARASIDVCLCARRAGSAAEQAAWASTRARAQRASAACARPAPIVKRKGCNPTSIVYQTLCGSSAAAGAGSRKLCSLGEECKSYPFRAAPPDPAAA